MKGTICFLGLLVGATACAQQPYHVEKENVVRIISVLASDEMNGREAFSDDIDKAADFIELEFASIGVMPMEGDDYLQEFELYSYSLSEASLMVNGVEVQEILSIPGSVEMMLDEVSSIQYIRADDDFRTMFNKYLSSETDMLVLVDTAHSKILSRYARFFSRAGWNFEKDGASFMFAPYSGVELNSVAASMKAELKVQGMKNVAAMIPGKRSDEFILFSAHYDHIGNKPAVEGDSIANGANDDASGTTAVLELARYFKSRPQPERTLLFLAFTAEEAGGYGSRYFSDNVDPDQIMAMFNIEMIGKPAVEGPNTAWITGWDKSDFGALLQSSAEGSIYTFYPDPYPDQNLFYRSDNASLARKGVPAHSISTTPIDVDEDYHAVTDEVSTLDLDHLTNTIRAIAVGAKGMVDGKLTPTRVDPSNVN